MDQPTPNQPEVVSPLSTATSPQPPSASQPATPPLVAAPPVTPTAPIPPKASSPWPWIVGGCLMMVLIICVTILLVVWWGIREAKKEIDERMDKFTPSINSMNVEAEEWQKKSQELRESLPDPEEFSQDLESSFPEPEKLKK